MSDAARAYAFAESLANGFVTPSEVIEWVDSLLLRTDDPEPALLDAAMAENDRNRLIGLLHTLGTSAEQTDVAQYLFEDMAVALRRDPSVGESIARTLYQMALRRQWPDPDVELQMYSFEDAFELAHHRIHGDPDAVRVELGEFLSRFQRAV